MKLKIEKLKNNTLQKLIYKNFLTSSLIPIFAIELVLIILYFGVSYYISHKSQETLSAQAQSSLMEISKRESENINKQFEEVSRVAEIMRDDHERFFNTESACVLPNGEVELKVHDNGALYKSKDNGGASIYYSSKTKIKEQELQKAKCSERMDPLLKSVVKHNPIITQAYFNSYDDFNRIYPYMEDAPSQYGPDLHMEDYNFYYLANASHNPLQKSVWTSAYLDPAGQGWMTSIIVPIYKGTFLEGVTGLDVTIDSLVQNVLSLEVPWEGSAFLVDESGMILAMSEKIEKILGLKELKNHIYKNNIQTTIEKPEEYNLLKSNTPQIAEQMQKIFKHNTPISTFLIGEDRYILSQYSIAETNWHLITLIDESKVYAPIVELKNQADSIGYFVIALMLLFYVLFFIYLMKKSRLVAVRIAEPIRKLSVMTSDLGTKEAKRMTHQVGITEIDQLVDNFNKLSEELDIRTQEYVQSQLREKMKEKDAEIAYRSGLFESASSYLHNIGNSLTMLDSKIRMLKNLSRALAKSEFGIEKVLSMLEQSGANKGEKEEIKKFLNDFNYALSHEVTAEIEDITNGIDGIKKHAIESIRHQQDIFNIHQETPKNYIQRFNLKEVLQNVCDNYQSSSRSKGVTIHLECPQNIDICTMKFQLISGLSNVVKNAIEAIEERDIKSDGEINIRASIDAKNIAIEVQDNGQGLKPEFRSKMFKTGFTTKKSGHGLGLHAFNNFLNANKGSIRLLSEGEGLGSTVYIKLGVCDG